MATHGLLGFKPVQLLQTSSLQAPATRAPAPPLRTRQVQDVWLGLSATSARCHDRLNKRALDIARSTNKDLKELLGCESVAILKLPVPAFSPPQYAETSEIYRQQVQERAIASIQEQNRCVSSVYLADPLPGHLSSPKKENGDKLLTLLDETKQLLETKPLPRLKARKAAAAEDSDDSIKVRTRARTRAAAGLTGEVLVTPELPKIKRARRKKCLTPEQLHAKLQANMITGCNLTSVDPIVNAQDLLDTEMVDKSLFSRRSRSSRTGKKRCSEDTQSSSVVPSTPDLSISSDGKFVETMVQDMHNAPALSSTNKGHLTEAVSSSILLVPPRHCDQRCGSVAKLVEVSIDGEHSFRLSIQEKPLVENAAKTSSLKMLDSLSLDDSIISERSIDRESGVSNITINSTTSMPPKSSSRVVTSSDEKMVNAKARKAAMDAKKKEIASLALAKKQTEAKRKRELAEEDKKKKTEDAAKAKFKSLPAPLTTPSVPSSSIPAAKLKCKADGHKTKSNISKTMPIPAHSSEPSTEGISENHTLEAISTAPEWTAVFDNQGPALNTMAGVFDQQKQAKEPRTHLNATSNTQEPTTCSSENPVSTLASVPSSISTTTPSSDISSSTGSGVTSRILQDIPLATVNTQIPASTIVPIHVKPLVKFHAPNPLINLPPLPTTKPSNQLTFTAASSNTHVPVLIHSPQGVTLTAPNVLNNSIAAPHTPESGPTKALQATVIPTPAFLPNVTPIVSATQKKSPMNAYTPISHPRRGLNIGDLDNYEISDVEAEHSDDDEESKPNKHVPAWARDPLLSRTLKRQVELAIDPDCIFPSIDPHSCNLSEIFKHVKRRRRFRERTSSARWDQDALNVREIQAYRAQMGFRRLSLD